MTTSPSSTEIENRISTYTPTTLPAQRWAEVGSQVRDLVRQTGPLSVEDAKSLLVVLCKYVAWLDAQSLPTAPLADQLTASALEAFAATLTANHRPKTAENQIGRLRRVHDTIAGIPPQPPRQTPDSAKTKSRYEEHEIEALLGLGDPVSRVVAFVLDTGIVAPDAHTHPGGFTRDDWTEARRVAQRSGMALTGRRLRATWARKLAAQQLSVLQLRRAGLTIGDLNAVARHARDVDVPAEELSHAR